ncbi:MAG: HigA family addiction module antidote protein [Proteobacteria bacterium]|nr:HigA family addiction module antidote protein [Pseudomonadota bacterium]
METNNKHYSDLAIPPGEYLLEASAELGLNQADLARRMGRPVQAISEIVKGIKAITPDTALQLEEVLGVPAHIWTGLEADYQLIRARAQAEQHIEAEAADVGCFPYAEMARLGWVRKTRKAIEKVRELRRFFGVASLSNLPDVRSYAPAFRKSRHKNLSHETLAAWLRAGALEAEQIPTRPFDKKALKALIPEFRQLSVTSPESFQQKLLKRLADVGVALVLLPHLPKTYTNGATFWIHPDKAVLMMTIRGSWADIFWFSLFHEIAHILLHDKRRIFLEDGSDDAETRVQEQEADHFASNTLIPISAYTAFTQTGIFTAQSIHNFAKSIGIAPGVVTGRLQHDGHIAHHCHSHREQYKWAL